VTELRSKYVITLEMWCVLQLTNWPTFCLGTRRRRNSRSNQVRLCNLLNSFRVNSRCSKREVTFWLRTSLKRRHQFAWFWASLWPNVIAAHQLTGCIVCLSVCLSVCGSVCLLACLPSCLFVCLSVIRQLLLKLFLLCQVKSDLDEACYKWCKSTVRGYKATERILSPVISSIYC